jgi:outer membrane protein TolC
MKKQTLQAKLEELRTQLAGVSALDEKTHAQLRSLVEDIEHAIETEGEEEAGGESLSGQAEDLVLKFEAEHPQLTSALNQVAIALANLGI